MAKETKYERIQRNINRISSNKVRAEAMKSTKLEEKIRVLKESKELAKIDFKETENVGDTLKLWKEEIDNEVNKLEELLIAEDEWK